MSTTFYFNIADLHCNTARKYDIRLNSKTFQQVNDKTGWEL